MLLIPQTRYGCCIDHQGLRALRLIALVSGIGSFLGEKGSDEDRCGRRIGACGDGLEPQNCLPGIAWLSTAFHVGDERMLFSIEFHADPHIESRIFLHGPIFNDLGLILGMPLSRRSSSAAPRSSTAFTELATFSIC